MVLERTKDLIVKGQEAAKSLPVRVFPKGRISDADLWIMMHGFAGAFTSIANTIKDVELQGNKPLGRSFKKWKERNWSEFDRRANSLRNLLVHRGESFTTIPRTEFVEDGWNDTWFPQYSPVFAIRKDALGNEREIDFAEWIRGLFDWWAQQVAIIEADYLLVESQRAN